MNNETMGMTKTMMVDSIDKKTQIIPEITLSQMYEHLLEEMVNSITNI